MKLSALALSLAILASGAPAASAAPAPTAEQTLSYTVNEYRLTDAVRAARKACYYAEYPAVPAAEPQGTFVERYTDWYNALPAAELAEWRAAFRGCVDQHPARHYLAETCEVTYLYPANQVVSRECEQR